MSKGRVIYSLSEESCQFGRKRGEGREKCVMHRSASSRGLATFAEKEEIGHHPLGVRKKRFPGRKHGGKEGREATFSVENPKL